MQTKPLSRKIGTDTINSIDLFPVMAVAFQGVPRLKFTSDVQGMTQGNLFLTPSLSQSGPQGDYCRANSPNSLLLYWVWNVSTSTNGSTALMELTSRSVQHLSIPSQNFWHFWLNWPGVKLNPLVDFIKNCQTRFRDRTIFLYVPR